MPWDVRSIRIEGVKGVLDKGGLLQLERSGEPRSLAVFAPNGCGKSAYADAVEFLFSRDGSVEHLGKGGEDSERGGKHALLHVLAEARGVTPVVAVELGNRTANLRLSVNRPVTTGRNDPLPSELVAILDSAPAHRILRQHDLRRFVVEMDPGGKFAELSRWLNLDSLHEALGHLTTVENVLRRTAPDKEVEERRLDVVKNTLNQVTTTDAETVLGWCGRKAGELLGEPITVASEQDLLTVTERLARRRDSLIGSGTSAELLRARDAAQRIIAGFSGSQGLLHLFQAAAKAYSHTHAAAVLRQQTKDSPFSDLWPLAHAVLGQTSTATCPVCFTPWGDTLARSQEGALRALTDKQREISQLQASKVAANEAHDEYDRLLTNIEAAFADLEVRSAHLGLGSAADRARLALSDALSLKPGIVPVGECETRCNEFCRVSGALLESEVLPAVKSLILPGVPPEARSLDLLVQKLGALGQALHRLAELKTLAREYRRVESAFAAVAKAIQDESEVIVKEVLGSLQTDVLRIYDKVHPDGAIPAIHISSALSSRTLLLRVDFHTVGRTVPPAGYLSESHINTLGLALFIASVKLFNREFPFVFLDDIVSSYDAEHRSYIVDVIADELADYQVLLTTHDERFFSMLRSRLADQGWIFERIRGWSINEGPQREADLIGESEIDVLLKSGSPQAAGNAVRQFMEEWLDKMCAEYRAYTVHKRGPKEFDRTLFDYWGPFVKRVTGLGPDSVRTWRTLDRT
jgi:hypothetical protein